MRYTFSKTMRVNFSLLMSAFVIISCAQEDVGNQLKVQIPLYDKDTNKFKSQIVNIDTLDSLREVRGKAAKVYIHPGVDQNYNLYGPSPNARYRKIKDYYVPSDYNTLQAITAYYHFENLMKWEKSIDADYILNYPRNVGVAALVESAKAEDKYNNAAYSKVGDFYIFFPSYSKKFPLATNPFVIAHEHFHALFHHVTQENVENTFVKTAKESSPLLKNTLMHNNVCKITKKLDSYILPTKNPDEYKMYKVNYAQVQNQINNFVYQSLHEGLADVWAWLYAGDENGFFQSMNKVRGNRSLNTQLGANSLTSLNEASEYLDLSAIGIKGLKESFEFLLLNDKKIDCNFSLNAIKYELGLRFARFTKLWLETQYAEQIAKENIKTNKLNNKAPFLSKELRQAMSKDLLDIAYYYSISVKNYYQENADAFASKTEGFKLFAKPSTTLSSNYSLYIDAMAKQKQKTKLDAKDCSILARAYLGANEKSAYFETQCKGSQI